MQVRTDQIQTSEVGVLSTSPESVIDDYANLMRSINYQKFLPKNKKTILKLNLSWSLYFPACSTQPWQLEGVLKTLLEDGYKDIVAVENKTVVTNPLKGAENNKWTPILKKYGIEYVPLNTTEWIKYTPKNEISAAPVIKRPVERIPNATDSVLSSV